MNFCSGIKLRTRQKSCTFRPRTIIYYFCRRSPISERHSVQLVLTAGHGLGGREGVARHLDGKVDTYAYRCAFMNEALLGGDVRLSGQAIIVPIT